MILNMWLLLLYVPIDLHLNVYQGADSSLHNVRYRLITSTTNGYDGSMMNALESEKQWNSFFGFPEGSRLGLFNAIQVYHHRICRTHSDY